jgi:phospholipid/cholesterol/gamma-HCH transport system permease protein
VNHPADSAARPHVRRDAPGWMRPLRFLVDVVRATVRRPPPPGRVIEEAYRIGISALPILLVISVFVGTNLALQGYAAFRPLGGQRLLGMFVALAGVRELAPLMVAAMVAAKAGTEMASQLAVMRIQQQIDAIEVMAIDAHWLLITPRLLGIVLVLPPLTGISIFALVVAALAVSVWQLGQPAHEFLVLVTSTTTGTDLLLCGAKAAVFGTTISLVSCYFGFYSKPGPTGVGSATNAAVVVSAVLSAILNYLMSELVYG